MYEVGMVRTQGEAAKKASLELGILNTRVKNAILESMADGLLAEEKTILEANAVDMEEGRKSGLRDSLLDRLLLTHDRLVQMAKGIRQVAGLPDPVGRILSGANLANGLTITKISVPLGVIGIIYEARPNVTADAIALCVKSGNAVILKGGREALHSNKAVSDVLIAYGEKAGLPQGSVQFVNVPDRAAVDELIHLEGLVDVVIPRGGAGLIKNVVHNASVPVIETGAGVCHTYVDAYANVPMAVEIAMNAKVNRPSTCNAMETLLVHKDIADAFLPAMLEAYKKAHVTILGDARTQGYSGDVQPATDEDWATEYGGPAAFREGGGQPGRGRGPHPPVRHRPFGSHCHGQLRKCPEVPAVGGCGSGVCETPPPGSLTGSNSASGRKSASAPRSSMPEGPWACRN